MKVTTKSRGASKSHPCTGCGDKGLVHYMKGKPAAKAAFSYFQSPQTMLILIEIISFMYF